jgi:hypothetical protein
MMYPHNQMQLTHSPSNIAGAPSSCTCLSPSFSANIPQYNSLAFKSWRGSGAGSRSKRLEVLLGSLFCLASLSAEWHGNSKKKPPLLLSVKLLT